MGAEPGTGPYDTGGYDTGAYDAGSGPSPGYGGETPGSYRVRDGGAGGTRRAGGTPILPAAGIRGPPRRALATGCTRRRTPTRPRTRPGATSARRWPGPRAGTPGREAAADAAAPPIPATGRLRRRADRTDRQPVLIRSRARTSRPTTPAKPVTALPAGDGGSRRSRSRSCGSAAPGRTMTTIRGPVPTRSMAFPTISSGATSPPTSRWPRPRGPRRPRAMLASPGRRATALAGLGPQRDRPTRTEWCPRRSRRTPPPWAAAAGPEGVPRSRRTARSRARGSRPTAGQRVGPQGPEGLAGQQGPARPAARGAGVSRCAPRAAPRKIP